jgi:hypothetical protein
MATYTASATTGTSCACCGTLDAATLQCRTRGGTATLCGFDEYTDISTPPKKYRIKTMGGDLMSLRCQYSDASCSTPSQSDGTKREGTCEYNVSNCALVSSMTTTVYQNAGCPAATIIATDNTCVGSFGSVAGMTLTTARIQQTRTGDDVCNLVSGIYEKRTGTQIQTLSEEDTEQDALDRLLAGAGGTWDSWRSPGGTGCTGTPPPCCLARWEERTSGFSFVYQEAQYRVTASGLNPSTSYSARVEIYRRTFGSGTYTLFQTLIVSGTTDGSGAFSEDGDVPNEKGFESYAYAAYIVIPS